MGQNHLGICTHTFMDASRIPRTGTYMYFQPWKHLNPVSAGNIGNLLCNSNFCKYIFQTEEVGSTNADREGSEKESEMFRGLQAPPCRLRNSQESLFNPQLIKLAELSNTTKSFDSISLSRKSRRSFGYSQYPPLLDKP